VKIIVVPTEVSLSSTTAVPSGFSVNLAVPAETLVKRARPEAVIMEPAQQVQQVSASLAAANCPATAFLATY
jgi:hypothetical protein